MEIFLPQVINLLSYLSNLTWFKVEIYQIYLAINLYLVRSLNIYLTLSQNSITIGATTEYKNSSNFWHDRNTCKFKLDTR
jgi:hypothetical protein